MNIRPSSIGFSFIVGSILALSTSQARAATLFSFGTDFSYPGIGSTNGCTNATKAQCDIALLGISLDNQYWSVNSLLRVTDVALLNNYGSTGMGGASLDRGDLASGIALESLNVESDTTKAPQFNTSRTEIIMAEGMGNQQQGTFNLNNIIDTEDDGVVGTPDPSSVFSMDLLFDNGASFNSLLLWERGMNSDIMLQPIYEVANQQAAKVGDSIVINKDKWVSAGFSIDTTEISQPQEVGSVGVTFASDIKGVRVLSSAQFDGPDFKIAAIKRSVPEPGAVVGLALVGGVLAVRGRRKTNQNC